jgi:hypothetical protein
MRILLIKQLGNNQIQHSISEEFKAFIRALPGFTGFEDDAPVFQSAVEQVGSTKSIPNKPFKIHEAFICPGPWVIAASGSEP